MENCSRRGEEKDIHSLDTIFSFRIYSQHLLTGLIKSRQAVTGRYSGKNVSQAYLRALQHLRWGFREIR